MKDPYLLHMFNSTKNVSPFDVNMAYEADFTGHPRRRTPQTLRAQPTR